MEDARLCEDWIIKHCFGSLWASRGSETLPCWLNLAHKFVVEHVLEIANPLAALGSGADSWDGKEMCAEIWGGGTCCHGLLHPQGGWAVLRPLPYAWR